MACDAPCTHMTSESCGLACPCAADLCVCAAACRPFSRDYGSAPHVREARWRRATSAAVDPMGWPSQIGWSFAWGADFPLCGALHPQIRIGRRAQRQRRQRWRAPSTVTPRVSRGRRRAAGASRPLCCAVGDRPDAVCAAGWRAQRRAGVQHAYFQVNCDLRTKS